MNKFRGKGGRQVKTTEFYRSGGPLRNFQMKSGRLGRSRNFTARAAAYSKKMGAYLKNMGGSRKKGAGPEEKSPRLG